MERRLFNPREWPVLLVVALAAVIWLALSRSGPGGTRAIVERGGEIVLSRELGGLKATETVGMVCRKISVCCSITDRT